LQISKMSHEKLLAAIDSAKTETESARAVAKRSEDDARIKIDLLHEVRARDLMTQAAILSQQKSPRP
jgi:hypothetical protein